jgi:NADPH2:quinone reductase
MQTELKWRSWKMRTVRVHQFGGPEVMVHQDVSLPEPAAGQARVKLEAIGVNFTDIYHRKGSYPGPLPLTVGSEGAGVVEALGPGDSPVKVGERVGFAMQQGAYAEAIVVPTWKLVPIPDEISLQIASAVLLQGMTAHYLAHDTYPLRAGDLAVVHAAAGGTGGLLVQIAKLRGARVLGTVSTAEKAERARADGADEVILYSQVDFEQEVKRLTGGRGVSVVYDSVGRTTFEKSLNCLQPRGMMVLYGQSSGAVPPIDPQVLNAKGSLFLTRPTLTHYIRDRAELLQRSGDLFRWISSGQLNVRIDRIFPLGQARQAHEYLEGRQTKGKVLMLP